MYNVLMFIAVDIGGSKILVAAGNQQAAMLDNTQFETPASFDEAMRQINNSITSLSAGRQLKAIVIAAPGRLDFVHGKLIQAANISWGNAPIVDRLKHFGVPIVLENDANAAALGEAVLGAGVGHRTVLYLTISTGIGTGLVIDGQIYHGAHDTEGGHMTIDPAGPHCGCGGDGHFESIVSGKAIKRRFGQFAYQITDPKIWDQIAADIATGLDNLITVLSPEIVVMGGGVNVHWDKFHTPLLKHLKARDLIYPLPKIVPAKHMETAVVYGCFLLAKQASNS